MDKTSELQSEEIPENSSWAWVCAVTHWFGVAGQKDHRWIYRESMRSGRHISVPQRRQGHTETAVSFEGQLMTKGLKKGRHHFSGTTVCEHTLSFAILALHNAPCRQPAL